MKAAYKYITLGNNTNLPNIGPYLGWQLTNVATARYQEFMELAQNNTVSSGEKLGALQKSLSVKKKIDAAVAQNKPEIKNANPSTIIVSPYVSKACSKEEGLDFVKY